ncbi:MAG: YHS domain-containing protein [Sedimentisphaerales bacterium]
MKNTKMSGSIVLLMIVLIIGVVSVNGCKKQPSPSPAPVASESQTQPAAPAAEQTICPVMGGPVNKDIFVEYQGKKVYFCCEACKAEFNKEPEKYLPKLPQFAK